MFSVLSNKILIDTIRNKELISWVELSNNYTFGFIVTGNIYF